MHMYCMYRWRWLVCMSDGDPCWVKWGSRVCASKSAIGANQDFADNIILYIVHACTPVHVHVCTVYLSEYDDSSRL